MVRMKPQSGSSFRYQSGFLWDVSYLVSHGESWIQAIRPQNESDSLKLGETFKFMAFF